MIRAYVMALNWRLGVCWSGMEWWADPSPLWSGPAIATPVLVLVHLVYNIMQLPSCSNLCNLE